jgi:hypothetical protein
MNATFLIIAKNGKTETIFRAKKNCFKLIFTTQVILKPCSGTGDLGFARVVDPIVFNPDPDQAF